MSRLTLIATSAFGIESLVADELKSIGYENQIVENGRVVFEADEVGIARCNLWLRCADRVLLRVAEFTTTDFEELFQGVKAVPWADLIPENGVMHVTGKSIKSKLFSVPDCQSIVKKAVVEAMKKKYRRDRFPEDGPVYKIEVSLLKDTATITVDTSGPGLHKRGYRQNRGDAPLRETLAAALVRLSRWDPSRVLADPLCGSGTIAIEAGLAGRNIAPGLGRSFVAETWHVISAKVWKNERERARDLATKAPMTILASDRDFRVFDAARKNAEAAGLSDAITFQKKPLEEFGSRKKYGCVITNPPWGERMGEEREVEELYTTMGKVFSRLDAWSVFVLTAYQDFQKFYGRRASRNRKLYNGKILCYLYQYMGPLPERKKRGEGGSSLPESVMEDDGP